jgi:ABC-type sugar transport system ATPase subunit
MYIRQLRVEHLKRLANLELDFTHRGEPRMWTVLIGENGTAKTTLLQAIGLAAAGSKQVNTLVGSAVKHLRDRRRDEAMLIDARFDFTPESVREAAAIHPLAKRQRSLSNWHLRSLVGLEAGSTTLDARAFYESVPWKQAVFQRIAIADARPGSTERDPLDEARAANTPLWFVSGYGISRVLPDANTVPTLARPSIERLEPLFRPTGLVSTGFSNHFLMKDREEGRKAGDTSRLFSRMLKQAVQLGGGDLFPDLVRLELRGQGGAKSSTTLIESDRFFQRMAKGKAPVAIAGVALSHGYQSTFAWIADLIGHVLLESRTELDTTEMEGLVLIDEIDLYLHPTWQARFIPALRRVFPRMQFVATTHSPVVLSSLAPHEIVRLVVDAESGDIVQGGWDADRGQFRPGIQDLEHQPDPRLMTGGEIYRTWFGLEGVTPNPLGEKLRRLQILWTHPSPTPFQKKELELLQAELAEELAKRFGPTQGKQALDDFEKSLRSAR